jgi:hypothetical protein
MTGVDAGRHRGARARTAARLFGSSNGALRLPSAIAMAVAVVRQPSCRPDNLEQEAQIIAPARRHLSLPPAASTYPTPTQRPRFLLLSQLHDALQR